MQPQQPKQLTYKSASRRTKVPTYEAFKPELTEREQLQKNLETQYTNLKARLDEIGADDNRNFIERAFNLPQDQNLLMDVIEVINRPLRGVQAGLIAGAEDQNMLQGFWEGLSGQERLTGLDFAVRMGWIDDPERLTGLQQFLVNVGTDILFDPLTYVGGPFGLYKKLFGKGKAAKTSVIAEFNKSLPEEFSKRGVDFNIVNDTWRNTAREIAESKGLKLIFDDPVELAAQGIQLSKNHGRLLVREGAEAAAGAGTENTSALVLLNYMDEVLPEVADNIFVFAEHTSNRAQDLLIMVKQQLANGDSMFVQAGALEIKDLMGAFAKTFTLDLADNGTSLVVKMKGKVNPELTEQLTQALNQLQLASEKGNVSLTELVQQVLQRGTEKTTKVAELTEAGLSNPAFGGFLKEKVTAANTVAKFAQLLGGKKGKAFRQLDPAVQSQIMQEFQNIVADPTLMNQASGATQELLQTVFKKFVKEESAKIGSVTIQLADQLDTGLDLANNKNLRNLLEDLFLSTTDDYIGFLDPEGILRVVPKEDFFKLGQISDASIQFGAGGASKGRQLRFFPHLGLQEGAALGADTGVERFFHSMFAASAEQKQGLALRMMQRLTSESTPALIRTPAQIVKTGFDELGSLFNAGKGLTKEFMAKYARIGGTAQTKMMRKQGLAHRLIQKLRKVDSQADTYMTQIVESGADVIEGTIQYKSNVIRTVDFMDNLKTHARNGDVTLLPTPGVRSSGSQITAKNVVDRLNRMYKSLTGVDDAFSLVQKGDAYGVVLDSIDFKTLNSIDFNTLSRGYTTLDFGRATLSKEAADFLINNAADIASLRQIKNEVVADLVKELGFNNLPDALTGTPEYIRHILTREYRDYVAKQAPLIRSRHIKEGVNLLQDRSFLGTIDDVNRGLQAFYNLPVEAFNSNFSASMDDLMNLAMRLNEQHQVLDLVLTNSSKAGRPLFQVVDNVVGAADSLGNQFKLIENFDVTFGNLAKNLSPKAKKALADHLASLGFQEGKKVIGIHKSAYDMLVRVNRGFVDLPKGVRMYDKFLNAWKSFTLVTPGFHMRNQLGNATNSYLAGMGMPQQMRYGMTASMDFTNFKRISAQVDELVKTSGRSVDDIVANVLSKKDKLVWNKISRYADDGISQAHTGVRDLRSVKTALQESGRQNLTDRLIGFNFDVAEKLDDFQRYMLYQWAYDKNIKKLTKQFGAQVGELKAREAARTIVSDSLFDYKKLTSFEREYMKRLFPFYTFFKNNMVFQMQNIVRNPGAYGRLGRAYQYYSSDIVGLDVEDMPDYMADNMWLAMPGTLRKNDQDSIAFFKANLPPAQFAKLIANPLKQVTTSMAAPLKLPLELGAGINFFTGGRIQDFPGQRNRMEEGAGLLSGLRADDGSLALSANPIIQKIGNDIGLRVPLQYASIFFDLADALAGYQRGPEAILSVMERLGLSTTKTIQDISITELYQDLERLRNIRAVWEQENGMKLPTKQELGLP